jgi:nucleotide-binding universal stress UspA family protein
MQATGSATGAVVVGVDGSESATRAVQWAADLAARRRRRLRIAHAYGSVGPYYGGDLAFPSGVLETLADDARQLVADAAEAAAAAGPGVDVEVQAADAAPIPLLIELSGQAAMVVLGSSGRGGFAGMLAGSTAVRVAAHAQSPVVVVRAREGEPAPPAEGPVVVGVDGSSLSDRAVAYAFEEASLREASLVAVHAWADLEYENPVHRARTLVEGGPQEVDEERLLAERLAGWQEKYPDVPVERVIARDKPRHELLQRSVTAQLVVVGSRGRGGFRGLLLGSTSQALLHHAECPVMIVRPAAEHR